MNEMAKINEKKIGREGGVENKKEKNDDASDAVQLRGRRRSIRTLAYSDKKEIAHLKLREEKNEREQRGSEGQHTHKKKAKRKRAPAIHSNWLTSLPADADVSKSQILDIRFNV